MPSLPKRVLNRAILEALGKDVEGHGEEDDFPFELKVKGVIPLAVFAFTLTSPPGGCARRRALPGLCRLRTTSKEATSSLPERPLYPLCDCWRLSM